MADDVADDVADDEEDEGREPRYSKKAPNLTRLLQRMSGLGVRPFEFGFGIGTASVCERVSGAYEGRGGRPR